MQPLGMISYVASMRQQLIDNGGLHRSIQVLFLLVDSPSAPLCLCFPSLPLTSQSYMAVTHLKERCHNYSEEKKQQTISQFPAGICCFPLFCIRVN